jgi:hypothetical protein
MQIKPVSVTVFGTLEVLEHHVGRAGLERADVDHAGHVLAPQPDRRLCLPQEPLDDLLVSEHLWKQQLDRHRLMKLEVHRLHDNADATLAEHAVDAVPSRDHHADLHHPMIRHEIL